MLMVPCVVQLGWPDMKLPILVTMSWPERVQCSEQTWPRLDFIKVGSLTFFQKAGEERGVPSKPSISGNGSSMMYFVSLPV